MPRQGDPDTGPQKARSQIDHDLLRRLLQQARAGSAEAWEVLYRHTYPTLYGFARRRLGTDRDAEDAVAETMINAYDRIQSFVWRNGGLMAWLYSIMRELVADNQRAVGRHTVKSRGLDNSQSTSQGANDATADDLTLLERSFARLDPSEQDVLELRVMGGLDADQAGIVLGQRPGTVRAAQLRAFEKLQMLMKDTIEHA